jgi:catechol 2,3-dioxygenase-like lactoylglutathione lyase family enzyme
MMKIKIRIAVLVLIGIVSLAVPGASAQIPAGNAAGVAMGHLHLNVRDVEANKKFFAAIGGVPLKMEPFEIIKFPDVLIFLNLLPGAPPASGGMVGTVVDHFGFRARNLEESVAKWKAAGLKFDLGPNPGQAYLYTPDDVKFEVIEDKSINVPIANYHIHFFVPEGDVSKIQAWYAKIFDAKPGTRLRNQAADLPGVNLTFSAAPKPVVGTKGRILDHIGFEVKDLERFCKKLEAGGVKLDRPYSKTAAGLGLAFLTDPWGTYIELNEGLDRY